MEISKKQDNLNAAIALVARRFETEITLGDLAKEAEMPTNSLTRHFNSRFGISPLRWVWVFKTVLGAALIVRDTSIPIAAIAEQVGFGSIAHFSRKFHEVMGVTPTAYRSAHSDFQSARPTPLGRFEQFPNEHSDLLQQAIVKVDLTKLSSKLDLSADEGVPPDSFETTGGIDGIH